MEQNLIEKTGKTLEEWKAVLDKQSFTKHGEFMAYLKKDLGITHGYANFITLKYRKSDAGSADASDLVDNQYQGKQHLRPIYELLYSKIIQFGKYVEVVPKKAAVSFRGKRQFALIQPTTKKRIDLGLKFNNKEHVGRLETSGPFGSMCTHRIQLTDVNQIDLELLEWLKQAYDEAQ